jgi:hypothetical protein
MEFVAYVVPALLLLAVAWNPIIVAVLGLIGFVFAPVAAYLVAKRQFSGRIETTEAKELWAESRSIRQQAFDRIAELNRVVARLEERIEDLEQENANLRSRLGPDARLSP